MKESATGRERIIAAAIELFAERGYAGASVRDIAARASVTGGLIVHHFGTKAALREECDAVVIESVFLVPGIGRPFIQSAINRDYTLIMGEVVVYSIILIMANLIVDIVYGFLDPRISYK